MTRFKFTTTSVRFNIKLKPKPHPQSRKVAFYRGSQKERETVGS